MTGRPAGAGHRLQVGHRRPRSRHEQLHQIAQQQRAEQTGDERESLLRVAHAVEREAGDEREWDERQRAAGPGQRPRSGRQRRGASRHHFVHESKLTVAADRQPQLAGAPADQDQGREPDQQA
jgi:hypothetical protein